MRQPIFEERTMISSADNRRIKDVSALMKKAKDRKQRGLFVAEGSKMVLEAPDDWLLEIFVSESFVREEKNRPVLNALSDRGKSWEQVSDPVFRGISDTMTPQGILAVLRQPVYELQQLFSGERTLLLVLESIQDPGNLGTMFRAGEGAGVTGIVMNRTTVDLFNPKTVRSTMGSIYRVPFYVADELGACVEEIKAAGVALYAAHLQGRSFYDEMDYRRGCGFLIGNEGKGLLEETASRADAYVRIPMEGQVESLNAAVCASLLVYECSRQRRQS